MHIRQEVCVCVCVCVCVYVCERVSIGAQQQMKAPIQPWSHQSIHSLVVCPGQGHSADMVIVLQVIMVVIKSRNAT